MTAIRNYLNKKGQGIVEYSVLLSFIVGLAMMLNGANLGSAVKGTFDSVATVLGGEKTVAWGKKDLSEFNAENAAERLAADQKMLENLAKYFLGKKKSEIKDLLNTKSGDMAYNEKVTLGWIVPNEDGGATFTTVSPSASATWDGLSSLKSEEAQHIFNWMQGDYGKDGYTLNYDSSNKYLVSDYALSQGWTGKAGSNQNNGINIRLEYDNNTVNNEKKVIGVALAIDPGSQSKSVNSQGLEVQVRNGQTTFNNTGLANRYGDNQ